MTESSPAVEGKVVHRNLPNGRLVETALARGEGTLAENGALVVRTGSRTGRSPADRYVVSDSSTKDVVWWGPVNRPIERAAFDRILGKARAYLRDREVFVFEGHAGAEPRHRIGVRVVSEKAWHALFARTLFLRPSASDLASFQADWTVINACGLRADPQTDGTASDVFIGLDFTRRIVLVLGTHYAGEMKKSIFAAMNYKLPQVGVFPMHCSANVGPAGDSALFFGLSGTGKTTLSADPKRRLIGDDEHGWGPEGVFNVEGGCYAKCIKLRRESEPQIWDAIRFGSVLENVVVHPETRAIDYDDDSITENTRATYPVDYIPNCIIEGRGPHPKNVVFLTADAFGVLPPIAELTNPQAMYHYLSGYTAKVAGTEAGVTEPKATFSPCFGGPFLPLHPTRYATLLGEYLDRHRARTWLVNTGWSGGPYGVGNRMKIQITRALLDAALSGRLDDVSKTPDPVFGVLVPDECAGVPAEVLKPRATWRDGAAYDAKARELAVLFRKNFEQYSDFATAEVRAAGPRLSD